MMDIKTGVIRELSEGDLIGKNEIRIKRKPKENCRYCFGRGWIGRSVETGDVMPCRCVMKKVK
jgi:hypothetical protein